MATFFAVMKDTDYATKKVFVQNFWTGFRKVLKGENKQLITEFSKCDFTNIYDWNVAEREKKKLLTNEARVCGAAQLYRRYLTGCAGEEGGQGRARQGRAEIHNRRHGRPRREGVRHGGLVSRELTFAVLRRLATSALSLRDSSAAVASTPRWA